MKQEIKSWGILLCRLMLLSEGIHLYGKEGILGFLSTTFLMFFIVLNEYVIVKKKVV